MLKKVELLAPAGNYEGLLGAIGAGADAVYVGGDRFGARAHAENFDTEDLIRGINYVHLHGRKIYLTVNTLIKEREFKDLYDYLAPLYEIGLDGVIIQDMGVLGFIREQFPQMELHASTQMNVSHSLGAEFLRKQGVVRVVPARELSLQELKQINEKVDIELEIFIHGAMCYSYSGQCLFSSILGSRSGNRGRCAQPCRLPYGKENVNRYPLSMKDMCTIEILPELMEAGIHSFKVEGRMKKPEYAAGVTAVYRKYIDLYYEKGKSGYRVLKEDKRYLQSLYIRSEISEGYYHKHNGKDMITLNHPGYAGSDETLLKAIRNEYITSRKSIGINGEGYFVPGEPAVLTLSCGGITIRTEYGQVQPSQKQPLTEKIVTKQLQKSGNTSFVFENLELDMTDNAFMTLKELNQLRRQAIGMLEEKLLKPYRRLIPPIAEVPKNIERQREEQQELHILVTTKEQWEGAVRCNGKRIYTDIDLWDEPNRIPQKMSDQKWFAVLPRIFRLKDETYLNQYQEVLGDSRCDGVMIQNLESYQWLQDIGYAGVVVTDSSLYIWNGKAQAFWRERAEESYLPLELNRHEIKDILKQQGAAGSLMIYGRIPMMVSANCLKKTDGQCRKDKQEDIYLLNDRYGQQFPVCNHCKHCYTIIYNTVPLSLHDGLRQGKLKGLSSLRLDFTTETGRQTEEIITYFMSILEERRDINLPYQDYTTGHFKRGVE